MKKLKVSAFALVAHCLPLHSLAIFCVVAFGASVIAAEPERLTEFESVPGRMLFSFYSLTPPQTLRVGKRGVTALGPYYGSQAPALTYSNVERLPLIYRVGPKVDFATADPEAIDTALQILKDDLMVAVKNSSVAVWYLANEELRYWRKAEMDWLAAATALIRKIDPLNRPIMMYEPNHREADGLAKTGAFLDISAKGAYANHVGMKDSRAWVRHSIAALVVASKQVSNVPIAVLWMARDQTPEDRPLIPAWVRHDVYLSLITGAKGILVWSGHNRRKGFSRDYLTFYEAYLAVATELNSAPDISRVLLGGTRASADCVEQTAGETSQSFRYQNKGYTYPAVSRALYKYGESSYLFLVNSSRNLIRVSIACVQSDVTITNVLSGSAISNSAANLELSGFGVQILRWDEQG